MPRFADDSPGGDLTPPPAAKAPDNARQWNDGAPRAPGRLNWQQMLPDGIATELDSEAASGRGLQVLTGPGTHAAPGVAISPAGLSGW